MFAPEHVFGDVRKNRQHGSSWTDAQQKFGTATFVGDKRPSFLQGWNVIRRNFLPGQIKVLVDDRPEVHKNPCFAAV